MTINNLQFDDAIDALYKRHDGGQDTRKGVTRASEYKDRDSIPDLEAAALLVYLDIFRGVPVEGETDVFSFGADGVLAESAFDRMLAKTVGMDIDEVKKIGRSERGISYGAALEKINELLGGTALTAKHNTGDPLSRALAVELLAEALHTSDGSGKIPHLYYVPQLSLIHI